MTMAAAQHSVAPGTDPIRSRRRPGKDLVSVTTTAARYRRFSTVPVRRGDPLAEFEQLQAPAEHDRSRSGRAEAGHDVLSARKPWVAMPSDAQQYLRLGRLDHPLQVETMLYVQLRRLIVLDRLGEVGVHGPVRVRP